MKREKALLHNRTAQGLVLVGSFICSSLSWVWIATQEPTWIDWAGFITATAMFLYCLALTIKGWRLRHQKRTMNNLNQ